MKKLIKILGVVVTITLLASLMLGLVAAPAGADPGPNKWTKFKTPVFGSDGDELMEDIDSSLGPWARATDGTYYLFARTWSVSSAAWKNYFYKSSDGRVWSRITKYPGTAAIVAVVPSTKDAKTVYVADASNIYKTRDSGSTWTTIAAPPATSISTMDVGWSGTNHQIYVGTLAGGAGTVGVKATGTMTVTAAVDAAPTADLALNIDSAAITLALGDSASAIATKIATAVTAGGTNTTATAAAAVVTFTARTAGAAGNGALTMADASYYNAHTVPAVTMAGGANAVAQVDTVTPTVANSSQYILSITPAGGSAVLFVYNSDADATATEIVTGLAALVNASAVPVTASGTTTLILTADTVGTAGAFTSASVGAGTLTIANTTAAANAIAATGTATIPAGVDIDDLALNIDGAAITLAYGDDTSAIATKIATAVTASGATSTATAAAAVVTFTRRTAGAAGNGALTIADATYYNAHTVPAVTMAGGVDATAGGDVYFFDDKTGTTGWVALNVATDATIGSSNRPTAWTAASTKVLAVKVSPNYADDGWIMAVCTATVGGTGKTIATTKYGSAKWAADVVDSELRWGTAPGTSFVASSAATWIPGGFDSSPTGGKLEVLVGVSDSASGSDVYRVVGGSNTAQDLGVNYDIAGLNGVGNIDSEQLIAGTDDGNIIYSTDNGDTWTGTVNDLNKKRPTGTANVYPILASNFATSKEAFVAVSGTDAAISRTTDGGKTWNQVSFIDTCIEDINDFEPSPKYASDKTAFMLTDEDSLWKWDGKYWERVLHSSIVVGDILDVEVSPAFATDKSVFVLTNAANWIWRATDGGGLFKYFLSNPPAALTHNRGWLVVDRTTLFTAASGVAYQTSNSGNTWDRRTIGSAPVLQFALDPNNSKNILASNDDGGVYLSTNGGTSWKQKPTGTTLPGGDYSFVAFDPNFAKNNIIYAGDYAGEMYRIVVDTDDDWQQISGIEGTWPENIYDEESLALETAGDGARYNVVVGDDGVLYTRYYVYDVDNLEDANGVARSVNPTASLDLDKDAPYFEDLNKGWPEDNDGDIAENRGLWLTKGSSNDLWTIMIGVGTNSLGTTIDEVWGYTDEVTTPSLSGPADGSSTGRTMEASLTWKAVKNANEYYVWWDIDPGFANVDLDVQNKVVTTTSYRLTALEPGRTYYWKVAVAVGQPVLSLFSKANSFTTGLAASEWNPFIGGVPETPAEGATNVPLRPSFAWNPADWATGYEFELSTAAAVAADGKFTATVVSKTGANRLTNTVYQAEANLTNSTTYYWHVRAVSATSNSPWATGVFTTVAAPPAPPAPPPPAPPPPGTPAYIWTIIGIGAALVIAVIILILRTRPHGA